jgi:hypothetical protein
MVHRHFEMVNAFFYNNIFLCRLFYNLWYFSSEGNIHVIYTLYHFQLDLFWYFSFVGTLCHKSIGNFDYENVAGT